MKLSLFAIDRSKIRTIVQKRWPSLLAMGMALLLLCLHWWNEFCPDDALQIADLRQHMWRSVEHSPCLGNGFFSVESENGNAEIYISFSGQTLASERLHEVLADAHQVSCVPIIGPSFVEEVAYEPNL